MHPGVDFRALAELTQGYSGDDITNVVRDAAMNGMRRKIAGKVCVCVMHPVQSQG